MNDRHCDSVILIVIVGRDRSRALVVVDVILIVIESAPPLRRSTQ